MHSEKRNDRWNAERRKPAPMLAFQRNDTWNETLIPTPERSNHPLEGGTVERAERFHVVVAMKPASCGMPKGSSADLVVPRPTPGAHDQGRGWVESLEPAHPLTGRLPIRGFFSLGAEFRPDRGFCAEMGFRQMCARAHLDQPDSRAGSASAGFMYRNTIPENAPKNGCEAHQASRYTRPKVIA